MITFTLIQSDQETRVDKEENLQAKAKPTSTNKQDLSPAFRISFVCKLLELEYFSRLLSSRVVATIENISVNLASQTAFTFAGMLIHS